MNSALISIASKNSKPTHQQTHVQRTLNEQGLKTVLCSKISPIYELQGAFSAREIETVAQELLCDRVVETYGVNAKAQDKKTVFLDVWCKPGVTDPAGDSVLKAVRDLGIASVQKVSTGTRYELQLKSKTALPPRQARQKIIDFANQQLLNPLVQECKL